MWALSANRCQGRWHIVQFGIFLQSVGSAGRTGHQEKRHCWRHHWCALRGCFCPDDVRGLMLMEYRLSGERDGLFFPAFSWIVYVYSGATIFDGISSRVDGVFNSSFLEDIRDQELCGSRGSRPGLPVPNKPDGFCGRKATLNRAWRSLLWMCFTMKAFLLPTAWTLNCVSGVLTSDHGGFLQYWMRRKGEGGPLTGAVLNVLICRSFQESWTGAWNFDF